MNKNREALLGFVIVAGILLTAAGTIWMQGVRFGQGSRTLEAVLYEVGQVAPGNGVKLRGVEVGRVSQINVDPAGNLVRLELRLYEELALPPDPVIILSPESMFGDWQAEIRPRSDFPYANYPEAPGGGVLPGYALPDITQLTAAAQRISENLGVLTERFGIAFSEETALNVASLIDNIENVTTELSGLVEQQAASFAEVTDGVEAATDEIASAAEQVRSTFADASELLNGAELTSAVDDLAEISANLRELSGQLGGTNEGIRSMAETADATFQRVESMLESLESGEGTLGRLFRDEEMAAEIEATLTELSALLEDIRENPNRYVRLSIF